MKIKEIKLENFRQYMDVSLEFPQTATYDLNYILAENGIGKTTLLNSITWCLYGKELHTTEGLKDKTLPLLTLKTLREMEVGEERNSTVRITLEDTEGDISFVRWVTYRKTEEGTAYEKSKDQKVVIVPKGGEPDVLNSEDDFKVEVNKRLPFKIQQFFFFDGEQLDTYLASAAGENVEQTVLQISQIDLLVTMQKNLGIISDEMRRTAFRSNSKSSEINKKYESKQKEVEQLNETYQKNRGDLEKAKIELENINTELGDDPDVSELEVQREELDKKLRALKDDQTNNINDIKYFLKKYLTLLSSLPRLKKMYSLIKKKEENKQLPPKYDKADLEKMLSEHHCDVCNRELDSIIDKYTNKEHIILLYAKRNELEKYIESAAKSVMRQEIELENLKKEIEDLRKVLDEALGKDEKNKKLRKEAKLAEDAKNKVTEIISGIKGDIRKHISEEMRSKFFELMWKTKFSNVEITENYSASVINNDGFECLGSCSAAERELLVLAFTLALHKESGFDGPLVIDTPISRISGDLRVAFAKVLRSVSQNKQIILFVTEDEYSVNVRDVFEPYANRKYKFELIGEDFVKVGVM